MAKNLDNSAVCRDAVATVEIARRVRVKTVPPACRRPARPQQQTTCDRSPTRAAVR